MAKRKPKVKVNKLKLGKDDRIGYVLKTENGFIVDDELKRLLDHMIIKTLDDSKRIVALQLGDYVANHLNSVRDERGVVPVNINHNSYMAGLLDGMEKARSLMVSSTSIQFDNHFSNILCFGRNAGAYELLLANVKP